ncbi:MAG: hypothetical protein NC133_02160 [Prevotella sp.]|nr:hypothetical protein [Prevotella sp.]
MGNLVEKYIEMKVDALETDDFKSDVPYSEMSDNSKLALKMVKKSYAKLDTGYARIRMRIGSLFVISILAFIAVGLFFCIYAFPNGMVGLVLIVPALSFTIYLLNRSIKIFDVYYFTQNKKKYIFYINKGYTILCTSTKNICIKNRTKAVVEYPFYYAYMNAKMGYNRMVGQLKIKKQKHGYKISTTQFKSSRGYTIKGQSKLTIDDDSFPKRITVGEYYEYVFEKENNFSFTIPRELVEIAKEKEMEFNFDDSRIIIE